MPLTDTTKKAIVGHLHREISRYIRENKLIKPLALQTKPFHARLLPDLFATKLSERSFSTRSGSWFQEIAKLVASQFHKEAHLAFTLHGHIQSAASSHINTLLEQMNKGKPKKRVPNCAKDILGVVTVQSPGGSALAITADLFVLTHSGHELYFEMKTPSPNKDTCMAMKRFILQVAAIRADHTAQAFAATAYNPYGDGMPYKWNYALQFLEVGQDMLIGRAFWEKIGDKTTYDELLDIAEEVGRMISTDILAAAADEPSA